MEMMTAAVATERVLNAKGVLTLDYPERTFVCNRQLKMGACVEFVFCSSKESQSINTHIYAHVFACACASIRIVFAYTILVFMKLSSLDFIDVRHSKSYNSLDTISNFVVFFFFCLCIAVSNYSSWNGSTVPVDFEMRQKIAMTACAVTKKQKIKEKIDSTKECIQLEAIRLRIDAGNSCGHFSTWWICENFKQLKLD